jgi:predicted small metal-binding protein
MPADLDQLEGDMLMARTVFDCARVPGKTCTLQIIGDKKDVLPAAKQHLMSAHGMRATAQLEENLNKVVEQHARRYSSWV